ncbi:MAG TPA: hypothetical protein VK281_01635 [Xanthobacteraceae bacterium]|nr:hypothetical protein [Xanthobacteraceae bacterium]
MTHAELDHLQRDVEAARGRLAGDVARLRHPATLSGFRTDLAVQVGSFKDEVMQKAADSASSTARAIWSDLKTRAAANPGAAFAIGAGLAWHFARHPPVTTLLVGLGLSSLLRTSPSSGPSPIVTRTSEFAGTLTETAREWSEEARDAVATAGEKTGEWAEQFQQATADAVSQAATTVSRIADEAPHLAEQALTDRETRDNYLLGVAALAVGAATVIAIQRTDG